MSIKSAPYFWLECDKCKSVSTDGDYSAWSDESTARVEAESGDWLVEDDRQLCRECAEAVRCTECLEVWTEGMTSCPDPECAETPDTAPVAVTS